MLRNAWEFLRKILRPGRCSAINVTAILCIAFSQFAIQPQQNMKGLFAGRIFFIIFFGDICRSRERMNGKTSKTPGDWCYLWLQKWQSLKLCKTTPLVKDELAACMFPPKFIYSSLIFSFLCFLSFPNLKVTNPISTCCNPIGAMKLHKVSKSGHLIRAEMSRITHISARSAPIW